MRRPVWIAWAAVALAVLALSLIGFKNEASSPSNTAIDRDHSLTKAVWDVLRSVPALSGNDTLRVKVKNAVVKLEGVVGQPVQKQAAQKAAESVAGVTTVINLIEVQP